MNSTTGFLSFNKKPPQLHLCGDDPTFDPATLRFLRDENFTVHFHTLSAGKPALVSSIAAIADSLDLGEHYALVAYGAAAAVCLQLAQKPMPRLCALVAHYPTALTSPNFKYPAQLPLVLHLAGAQSGVGGMASGRSYRYPGTEVGFAEMDLDEYEPVAAGLAWSRTLGTLRKGFGTSVDLEGVVEEHLQRKRHLCCFLPLSERLRCGGFVSSLGALQAHNSSKSTWTNCIRRDLFDSFYGADWAD